VEDELNHYDRKALEDLKLELDEKFRQLETSESVYKELVKISYLLDELKKDKYTKHILRHLANDNIAKGSEVLAAELATSINRYDFAIQVSKIASYQKRFHNKYNYPIISTPKYINKRKICIYILKIFNFFNPASFIKRKTFKFTTS